MAVAARDARDGAEAGCHEGRPVFHQHEVGPLPADAPAHAEPIEGIDRIDAPADVEVGGRRRIDGLALAVLYLFCLVAQYMRCFASHFTFSLLFVPFFLR